MAELTDKIYRMIWNLGLMTGAMVQMPAENKNGVRTPKITPGRVYHLAVL